MIFPEAERARIHSFFVEMADERVIWRTVASRGMESISLLSEPDEGISQTYMNRSDSAVEKNLVGGDGDGEVSHWRERMEEACPVNVAIVIGCSSGSEEVERRRMV